MTIREACDAEECTDKLKKIHADLARRGWHSHPSQGFLRWWKPDGINHDSGAETGGHQDAYRKCANPETRAWGYYGIKAGVAYNMSEYYNEYLRWLECGSPPRTNDCDGTAAPIAEQKNIWKKIRNILKGSTIISGAERFALDNRERLALEDRNPF